MIFKETVKENERGIGWNLSIFGDDRDPKDFYLIFLSLKIKHPYTQINLNFWSSFFFGTYRDFEAFHRFESLIIFKKLHNLGMEQVFCNRFWYFETYHFEHEKMQLLLLYCLFLLQMDETWNHVYSPYWKVWSENKFYNNLQDKNVFSDSVILL